MKRIYDRIIKLIILIGCVLLVTSCGSQGVTSYEADIVMSGGSGKAYIESPVNITEENGSIYARLVWNSKNYDYMIVDGVRYDNETPGDKSSFTVPVKTLDEPLDVIGDTVAMSVPHEVGYVIYWSAEQAAMYNDNVMDETDVQAASIQADTDETADENEPDYDTLVSTGEMTLNYAERFSVTYMGEYDLIHIDGDKDYLLVPEGSQIPGNVPRDITVIKQPLDKTYLVSTSAMDLVSKAGALDMIRMASLEADDWYVEEAREAMERGDILYAGKYRAPDYETVLGEGCNLAVENTMITHEPAVKEKLEELGIPVMVEMSSYETHPLGRLEWIRLYGVLFDTEEIADKYYEEQMKLAEYIMEQPDTGMSVAFFHVTSNGLINVRKPGDYISRMIELTGGRYILDSDEGSNDNMLSTMNMQMEDFYIAARDADIIIYNSAIGGELSSVDELISRNSLFADYKAVQNGSVYTTTEELFQQTTGMAQFMSELRGVLTGEETTAEYIKKVD